MTTYYRYNALTRVLTAEKRYIVLEDMSVITNPTAEQYADLRDAYPRGEDAPQEPPEGQIAVYAGYELGEDKKWHKQWFYQDPPPPPPRIFSKFALEGKLFEEGLMDQVDAFIDSQVITNQHGQTMPLRRRYNTALEFSEDHPDFDRVFKALKQLLGVTDEKAEEILAASVKE